MAPRRKKTEEPTGELCPEHFPDGWEGIDKQHEGVKVTGVGCEHGTFNRADTESPKDPPKDPDPSDPENPDGGKGGGE